MNKIAVLRVVNAVLLLSFFMQVITSFIIFLKLRVPFREFIFEAHEYNGLLLITTAALHVILNWGWIKANFFKKKEVE